MSRRERCRGIHQPTVGVSSVATASKNQATPLRRKYAGELRVRQLGKAPTWFHKRHPKPIRVPPCRRRRYRPKSMMRSRMVSAANVTIVLSLMPSKYNTQPSKTFITSHDEPNCGR